MGKVIRTHILLNLRFSVFVEKYKVLDLNPLNIKGVNEDLYCELNNLIAVN